MTHKPLPSEGEILAALQIRDEFMERWTLLEKVIKKYEVDVENARMRIGDVEWIDPELTSYLGGLKRALRIMKGLEKDEK